MNIIILIINFNIKVDLVKYLFLYIICIIYIMFNIKNKQHHLKLFIFFILIFLSLLFFFENSLYNYLIFIIISNFTYYVIDKKNIINFFFITIVISSIICIYLLNQNKYNIIEPYSDVNKLCNEISGISRDKYDSAMYSTIGKLNRIGAIMGRTKNNALIAKDIVNHNSKKAYTKTQYNLLSRFQRDNYSIYRSALYKLIEIFKKFGDVKDINIRNKELDKWSNTYCKNNNYGLARFIARKRQDGIKELNDVGTNI